VIGNPVEHSISPQLHNTIFRLLNENYIYVPFLVEENSLEEAVKGLKASNLKGFNVTVPFKKKIMNFIDEPSKEAILIGAVNTVKNVCGKLFGYNTDAEGFARAFKNETGTDIKNKNVVVVGAGGSARAIIVKLATEEANSVCIINRTLSKADEISKLIKKNLNYDIKCFQTDEIKAVEHFSNADIIINATSAGLYPDTEKMPVSPSYKFTRGQIVFDLIYNPIKTKFLKCAENEGCRIFNGLGMLFYQGILSNEIWLQRKIEDEKIRQLYNEFMNDVGTK
jgi:shikimate dehydrogenase